MGGNGSEDGALVVVPGRSCLRENNGTTSDKGSIPLPLLLLLPLVLLLPLPLIVNLRPGRLSSLSVL